MKNAVGITANTLEKAAPNEDKPAIAKDAAMMDCLLNLTIRDERNEPVK